MALCRSLMFVLVAVSSSVYAEELSYFLPSKGAEYDKNIPTPESVLNFKTGDRHITHHQLVTYVRKIAEVSPRVTVEQYAKSHGERPLLMVTVTSESNHKNIDSIRQQHRALSKPEASGDIDISKLPAVINMGYSVHGDESSGANSVPVVLYHLAAAQGEEIEKLLNDVVILMDPCLNPDGFNRFANWANAHRGKNVNADPAHAEHNQPWPGGRVNYYWFDLNRDWLPAVHPESQGRLRKYHEWKPDVLLDFHEMGTSSTYFFQPGIPERANPLIPDRNIELTNEFAKYHAKALDKLGSLYFTEEVFDDFYPGKGSSYPDLHGAVGILFEQASSRGHAQEGPHGELNFAFTIRNQVATSFSSLAATQASRESLLSYRRKFHRDAMTEAGDQPVRSFVFSSPDTAKLQTFAELLSRHDIEAKWTTKTLDIGDHRVAAGSIVVSAKQPEYRFLQALTERRTDFRENIFYDVSTWTLDLAYNFDLKRLTKTVDADSLSDEPPKPSAFQPTEEDIAWTIDTSSYASAGLINRLLQADAKLRVATKSFRISGDKPTDENLEDVVFGNQPTKPVGTVVLPLGIQETPFNTLVEIMTKGAEEGVRIDSLKTGLTPEGIDLGSNSMRPLQVPKILLVIQGGTNRYAAGATWHLLDARIGMPVTLVPQDRIGRVDLSRYNTIVMPTGSYRNISSSATESISEWLSEGGTLIAMGTATQWANSNKLASVVFRSTVSDEDEAVDTNDHHHDHRPYADARNDQALKLISGAIFEGKIDLTHPLSYGMTDSRLPLFRNNRVVMEPTENPYSNPVILTDTPLMSGYCSDDNVKLLAKSASVIVRRKGSGRVILMAEDPNFRGFWYGTNKLFLNAILYGPIIREP
ncbi:MAG: M14 family metallopeptidase [Planctomycetaceae bacterium]